MRHPERSYSKLTRGDIFIFQRQPEIFHLYMIPTVSAPVQADLNVMGSEFRHKLRHGIKFFCAA